ncbi:MAG: histidine kinase [Sphingomonas sp.]
MAILPSGPRGSGITARAALLSILGFWLFYFLIVTVRSAVLGFEDQVDMLGRRALVTLASMVITFFLWLVLRRLNGNSLGRRVLVAGMLALPAAVLYSSVSYNAFASLVAAARPPAVPAPPRTTRTTQSEVTISVGGTSGPFRIHVAPPPPPPIVSVQVGSSGDERNTSAVMAIADNAANGYFFFVAWAALFLALSYAADVGAAERRAAQFRAAAQSAELRALRYQVNPHFLFNTLNSLSSLIMTDRRDAAEAMVMNLATFFRTSLAGDPSEDVVLADEIRLQRLYLEIEAVRFPERMRIEIDVPDTLSQACVPGLILQPRVENAVKYGVSRARRPVTVSIRADAPDGWLRLRVEDDGDRIADARDGGTGIGLRNVSERLAARFGPDRASATWSEKADGGWAVVLLMPLIFGRCES